MLPRIPTNEPNVDALFDLAIALVILSVILIIRFA
jgi:hypothetical protein